MIRNVQAAHLRCDFVDDGTRCVAAVYVKRRPHRAVRQRAAGHGWTRTRDGVGDLCPDHRGAA